jgi:post-segregation antitoxin (ccd killing protein)
MGTKRKISVTVDRELLAAVEAASKSQHMPLSRVAQEALAYWLRKKTAELMAKGYEEMAEEDRSYAETALEAQRETLE